MRTASASRPGRRQRPGWRGGRHGVALAGIILAGLLGGCGARHAAARAAGPAEPRTVAALLRVAAAFNADYAANRDALVYDRWDARSRGVIGEPAYVRRHAECNTAPGPATVERAQRAGGGYWSVEYSISGIQFVDYWVYQKGRWQFDLLRSNPSAVRLYRMPYARYAAAVGCSPAR